MQPTWIQFMTSYMMLQAYQESFSARDRSEPWLPLVCPPPKRPKIKQKLPFYRVSDGAWVFESNFLESPEAEIPKPIILQADSGSPHGHEHNWYTFPGF